jgi:hypothetical protein
MDEQEAEPHSVFLHDAIKNGRSADTNVGPTLTPSNVE